MKGEVPEKAENSVAGPEATQVACAAEDQALAGGTAGSLTASVVAVIGPRGAVHQGRSEQRKEGSLGLPGSQGRSLGLLAAADHWQLAWCSCSGWLDA